MADYFYFQSGGEVDLFSIEQGECDRRFSGIFDHDGFDCN